MCVQVITAGVAVVRWLLELSRGARCCFLHGCPIKALLAARLRIPLFQASIALG